MNLSFFVVRSWFQLPVAAVAAAICLTLPLAAVARAADPVQAFELEDHVDLAWEHELVSFPLNEEAVAADPGVLRLLSPAGEPVPFQIASEQGEAVIWFHADLPALEAVTYRLERGAADSQAPASDVSVAQAQGQIRLTNGRTGIALAADAEQAGRGPIASIRMPDGRWVGRGRLQNTPAIESYEARIVAEGPVYAEAECVYTFEDGSSWRARFRLAAKEPVALVRESMSGLTKGAAWRFVIPADAAPTHLVYRVGSDTRYEPSRQDAFLAEPVEAEAEWSLRPWHHWWLHNDAPAYQMVRAPEGRRLEATYDEKQRTSDVFLYRGESKQPTGEAPVRAQEAAMPAILIGAGKAGDWSAPGLVGKRHAVRLDPQRDGELALSLPLNWPGRRWFLGSAVETRTHIANTELTLAHQMLIKHFDRPLNEIKDLVLEWPRDPSLPYPMIFPSEQRLAQLREQGLEIGFDINRGRVALKQFILDPESDPEKADKLAGRAVWHSMNFAAGFFLDAMPANGRGRNAAINSSHHQIGRKIEASAIAADLALGYGNVSPEQEKLIRARLAVAAYYVAGDHSVSPELGFAQLENMTAMMYGGLGLVASVLPDHPEARNWAARTAEVYGASLAQWSGPNGGWSECPHYQLGSLNSMLMFGLATDRSGISDFLYDPRIKQSVSFLAKLATPRDPRHGHYRHLPPLGNTYLNETSDVFAIMAAVYEQRDPSFASHMQWMWQAQGEPNIFSIGGDVSLNWINDFLYQPDIEPRQPDYRSEQFPLFGAVFRHGYATDRETYLAYHHGPAWGHYDFDQGSFEMWALGQPLMLDWGYHHRMPAWQHNTASFSSKGRIHTFAAAESADFAAASQTGWDRDLIMVRPTSDDGQPYFLVQDRLGNFGSHSEPAIWYWFNTEQMPRLDGQTVRVVGPGDVSLDVWLDGRSAKQMPVEQWGEELEDVSDLSADDFSIGELPGSEAADSDAPGRKIKAQRLTIPAWEGRHHAYWKRGFTTQHGINIPVEPGRTVNALLLPRPAAAPPAQVEALHDGQVLQVRTAEGVDYLLLADEPTDLETPEGVRFTGRAGVVQVRGDVVYLTLLDGSSIGYGKHELKEPGQTRRFAP